MYRISELIKLDRKVYHTQDLAILWKISNKNTLYTTVKRYVKKGILFQVYKGLYSTVPLPQLNPLELGKAIIHNYTYLTNESVLSQFGIINQLSNSYTFVAQKSKKVHVGEFSFVYRKLKDYYLLNLVGITDQNGILTASLERAVADMLYFSPTYHFDLPENIDWKKVEHIQREVGYI